jgi:MFS family permease
VTTEDSDQRRRDGEGEQEALVVGHVTAVCVARVRGAFRSGPLTSRSFRLYCTGQLTSTAGDYCYAVALPWLVLSNHGSPALLGTVLACYGVARAVLIPAGGVLADRIGPRRVMLSADVQRCAVVAVFAVLAARHIAALAALGPVAAAVGAGEGLFVPASFAIIPTVVEPEQLGAANSISTGIIQLGPFLGPVLGASLVAAGGPAPALVVDAATFAVSALTLMLIQLSAPSPEAQSAEATLAEAATPAAQVEAGGNGAVGASAATSMRELLRSRAFRLILLIVLASNAAGGGVLEVALPALAHQRYGVGGYGAVTAAISGGVIIGTFAVSVVKPARPMLFSLLAFLANGASCAALPYLGGRVGAVAAAMVFGMCNGFAAVLALTVVQRWAPPQLLGKVMSLIMLAAMGVFPLSAALTGILVRHIGPAVCFPLVGLTLAVTLAIGLASKEVRELGSKTA